jgi:hypothetical protein
MKFKLTLLLISFSMLFLYSCDEGGVSPEDCVKRWTVTKTTAAAVSVSGGRLNISSTVANVNETTASVLSKDTLKGDFDLTLNFEEFQQGSNFGIFFYLKVYDPADPGRAFIMSMQNVSQANTGNLQIGLTDTVATPFGTSGAYELTNTGSGAFRIKRAGSQITMDAFSGSASLNMVRDYNNLPLRFTLIYGSNFQQVTNSGVKIKDITITGTGNSSKSDAFNCNSLQ